MFKWYISCLLKNGKVVSGCLQSDIGDSGVLSRNIISGDDNTFFGFLSTDGKANILVRIGDLASVCLSINSNDYFATKGE